MALYAPNTSTSAKVILSNLGMINLVIALINTIQIINANTATLIKFNAMAKSPTIIFIVVLSLVYAAHQSTFPEYRADYHPIVMKLN